MKTLMAVTVVGLAAAAGQAQVRLFQGFNHPDGGISPQAYGMRLDNFLPGQPGNAVTFSFENAAGESRVTLALTEAGAVDTLRIFGTLFANSANGGTALGDFELDVTYTGEIGADGVFRALIPNGTVIGTLTATAGVNPISLLDAGQVLDIEAGGTRNIAANTPVTFAFGVALGSLDRLNGPLNGAPANEVFEGIGWLNSDLSSGTEDFLFTAIEVPIPTPGSLALLGLGGLAVARRRR